MRVVFPAHSFRVEPSLVLRTGFAFRAGGDKQFENAEPPSPSRVASERKLSPAKQYKLGKVLALRDNKKAIRADLSKTSILRRMERTNARGADRLMFLATP